MYEQGGPASRGRFKVKRNISLNNLELTSADSIVSQRRVLDWAFEAKILCAYFPINQLLSDLFDMGEV